ncbi:MAG: polysaccharide deacetylase family protein [Clostridia bacterium]|nr:polysaccharide deacetylase family protein [Clostridia bacterium]
MTRKRMLCLLLALLLLGGCRLRSAEPGAEETGGVPTETAGRREAAGETEEPAPTGVQTETKDPADPGVTPPQTDDSWSDPAEENGAQNGVRWTVEDGVYRYEFPKRDESGRATIDEMYSFPQTRFSDQPDDWFGGGAKYDESTGEAVIEWERAPDVLEAIEKYHAIYRGDTSQKVVYLTFDTGYEKENGYLPSILDTLREKAVPAAFFVNGRFIETSPDLLKRMIDEGHIVGNHAKDHKILSTASVETFLSELDGLDALYRQAVPDAPPMLYFRPPSGNCNPWVLKFAEKLGYTTVLYSWAYYDYVDEDQPTWDYAMEKVRTRLHPGCIFMLHTTSSTSAAILGSVIDWVRSQGYEFLPICDIQTGDHE